MRTPEIHAEVCLSASIKKKFKLLREVEKEIIRVKANNYEVELRKEQFQSLLKWVEMLEGKSDAEILRLLDKRIKDFQSELQSIPWRYFAIV